MCVVYNTENSFEPTTRQVAVRVPITVNGIERVYWADFQITDIAGQVFIGAPTIMVRNRPLRQVRTKPKALPPNRVRLLDLTDNSTQEDPA